MMDIVIINLAALVLIGFVIWWFFGSKPKALTVETNIPIMILVENGVYQPSHINIPANKTVKLHFIRHDATPCAETVSFSRLNTSYQLPINQMIEIIIPPQQPGEIDFTCQMGMYRGKIFIV